MAQNKEAKLEFSKSESIIKKLFKIIYVLFINLVALFVLLYFLEIFLQFKSGNLFSKTKFYYQKKLEKEINNEVVLSFAPYKFFNKNKNIIPLSGISNKNTIMCLDKNNKLIYYKSDRYGFNNTINDENIKILFIGDSYVYGQCVENKFNLVNQINKSGLAAVGLGAYANGPLTEYATFKEYSRYFNFDTLVWVFTPDNDFFDVSKEKKDKILNRYLKEDNFIQNLFENNKDREKIIYEYLNKRRGRQIREFARLYHFDLAIIRNFIKSLGEEKNPTLSFKKRFNYLYDETNYFLIKDILKKVQGNLSSNDSDLLVVFNALNPDIMFPANKENETLKSVLLNKIESLKNFLDQNNINYLDFNEKVEMDYTQENINEVFNRIRLKWDHYTSKGYAILTQEILDLLKNQ